MFVYELENGRYFVSSNEMNEINYFIKMYEPKKIIEVIECKNEEEEYKVLYRYMKRYGVNNVRGLKYDKIELELSEVLELQEKLGYKRVFKNAIIKEDIEEEEEEEN